MASHQHKRVDFEKVKIFRYPDEVPKDLFRLADLDNDGSIDHLDLQRILTLCGCDAIEADARYMIKMANQSLPGVDPHTPIRWAQFRRIVLCDLQGWSDDEYRQMMALAAPRISTEIIKERLLVRQALINFTLKSDLSFDRMIQILGAFQRREFKIYLDAETLCHVLGSELQDDPDLAVILNFFDPTEFGKFDVRMMLVAIMSVMDVEVIVKGQYAYRVFRSRKTGCIGAVELEQILRCAHLSFDPEEMSSKAARLMDSLPSANITREDFDETVKTYPAAVFPYGGKDESDGSSDEDA